MTSLSQYSINSIKANQLTSSFDNISEPLLYHPHIKNQSANAYFFSKTPQFTYIKNDEIRKTVQLRCSLTKLAQELKKYVDLIDIYVSVNEFGASRKQESLLKTTMFYSDLDIYHTDKKDLTHDQLIDQILAHCEFYDIPSPNIIIYSGNGYYLKWLFIEKMSRSNFSTTRYDQVQKSINRIFIDFGADPKAMDVSRVLRLPGTVNSKTGNLCEVIYYQDERLPANTMYDMFTRYYVPEPEKPQPVKEPRQVKEKLELLKLPKPEMVFKRRDPSKAPKNTLSRMQLPKDRYDDLKTLIKLRNGNVDNSRMTFLFWILNFKALCGGTNFVDFEEDAKRIANELGFKKFEWSFDELTTLERKVIRHNSGYQKVKKQNDEYFKFSNLYTPKTEKLIGIFAITDEEQRYLKTIITKDEKQRRRVQSRLDKGMKPQTGESTSMPWLEMDISRRTYYRRKAAGKL